MSEPTLACDSERLQQYVAARLAESDRDALEQHLLECEACAHQVQLLAGMRDELRPASTLARGWLAGIAAGLVVAIGMGVLWMREGPALSGRPSGPAEPASVPAVVTETPAQPRAGDLSRGTSLEALATFTPPPYVSLSTRTTESQTPRPFDAAMEIYNAGRYDDAARALAAIVQRDPEHDAAALFLGISSLAAGRPAEAVTPLARVAERDGPYAGLARLMLARAYLLTREIEQARRELERLAAGGEPQAEEARALLTALPAR